MKRMSIVGLCLTAMFAFSLMAVASASAAPPEFGRCLKQTGGKYENSGCTKVAKEASKEKYEWYAAFGSAKPLEKTGFKAHQKESTLATLETVGGTKITCKAEENNGAAYTGNKTVGKIVAHFSGCETGGQACNSAGEPSGHITTFGLKGLIGYEKVVAEASKDKVEAQLTPESGTALAKFECSVIHVEVIGCVAHPVSANKMNIKTTEKFSAKKGEQKPDKFAGGPEDECALESNSGTGFEEAGQTITAILENEEKVEANTVV
jgi:hypothetical protein